MRALIGGTIGSAAPESTNVGVVTRWSHGRLVQPVMAAS